MVWWQFEYYMFLAHFNIISYSVHVHVHSCTHTIHGNMFEACVTNFSGQQKVTSMHWHLWCLHDTQVHILFEKVVFDVIHIREVLF